MNRIWVVLCVELIAAQGWAASRNERSVALPDSSIFNLDQTWTSDSGKKEPLASLRGRPLVVAMIYTSCQGACPLLVSDMKRMEAALPEALRAEVRFVLFSFDPERDTVKRLATYRGERALDSQRWMLLRSSANNVRELAAVLGLKYKQLPSGDFQHSNLITIVDSDGAIRQQVTGIGEETDSSVALLRKLAQPN